MSMGRAFPLERKFNVEVLNFSVGHELFQKDTNVVLHWASKRRLSMLDQKPLGNSEHREPRESGLMFSPNCGACRASPHCNFWAPLCSLLKNEYEVKDRSNFYQGNLKNKKSSARNLPDLCLFLQTSYILNFVSSLLQCSITKVTKALDDSMHLKIINIDNIHEHSLVYNHEY